MTKLYLFCASALCLIVTPIFAQEPPITFVTGTSIANSPNIPIGIAAADFDGDGKAEVVVINKFATTLSIYTNTSSFRNIKFGAKTNLTLGGYPTDIITGDVDHDDKPDIVVKTNEQNFISIYRNTSPPGSISFAPRVDVPAITYVDNDDYGKSMALAYLNEDSLPELVSTASSSQIFSIWKNTSTPGQISFGDQMDIPCANNPSAIIPQDLDSDGKQDLTVTSSGSVFSFFQNTGTGDNISVVPAGTKITGGTIVSLVAGDYDNDGKADLATLTGPIREITVFSNTSSIGSFSFANGVTFPFARSPYSLHDADFDGDGKRDFLPIGFSSPGIFEVYKNNSSPGVVSFTAQQVAYTSQSPRTAVVKDFDGDNKPDILAIDNGSVAVLVFRNTYNEPTIASFSPTIATVGTTVTIKGNTLTGVTAVSFGGVAAASYNVVNDSTIMAVVDTGAIGVVQVTSPLGTSSKAGFIFGKEPVITHSISMKGDSGTIISIAGKYLSTVSQISFGGISAASFRIFSDSSINAVVGTGASGDLVITNQFGSYVQPGFFFGPIPSVTSFTPKSGGANTVVSITGRKMTSTKSVTFGNIPAASFTIVNDTLLTASVGAGATGNIMLTSDAGYFTIVEFIYQDGPVITSFSPLTDTVGATITITGNNFSTTAADNKVFFGTVPATVSAATTTTLSVVAPPGAAFEPIRITTNNMTAYSDLRFSLRFPGTADSLTITAAFDDKISFATDPGVTDMRSADLDSDGKVDLVTFRNSAKLVSLYRNISTPDTIAFAPPVSFNAAGNVIDLHIEDVDNDTKPDLLFSLQTGSGLFVNKNTSTIGSISFKEHLYQRIKSLPKGLVARDLDYDGRADIVMEASTDLIGILRNGNGEGLLQFTSDIFVSSDSLITSLRTSGLPITNTFLDDINRDGKVDICVTSNSDTQDSLFIFVNAATPGTAKFNRGTSVSKGAAGPGFGASGDLDGDMAPDLAVANPFTGHIAIIRNQSSAGNLALAAPQLYATGEYPQSIAIGDIDGDGKPEIATGDATSNAISIFRNRSTPGSLAFSSKIILPAGQSPRSLFIGDLNGDGKAEIAAFNFGKDSIIIFRNKIGEPQVTPSGAHPVTGPVSTTIIVDSTVQTFEGHPYVQRHYDIHPANNPGTATATITLYFTQEDFDNYNMHPTHGLNLPSGPNDLAGKAALRVYQYHGFSTTSLPGSYTGEGIEIDPDDAKIVWNPISYQWEVTFDVDGFSGFFIATEGNAILPLQLLSFTGKGQPGSAFLKWQTTAEVGVAYFELQRSTDGQSFASIAKINAHNNGDLKNNYEYTDPVNRLQIYHYRLKITDKDGSSTFSRIVTVDIAAGQPLLVVGPNPAHGFVSVFHPASDNPAQLQLTDMTGKVIRRMSSGRSVYKSIMPLNGVKAGIYTMLWTDGSKTLTRILFVQ